jgi:high-affinity iron transporter
LKVRLGIAAALAAGTLTAGCGSSGGSTEAKQVSASPQQAIAEIAAVRKGLDQALATYGSGDRAAADQQVGDTYLQHFEVVEGPLEKVDKGLKAQLEVGMREELRGLMKDGAPKARVGAKLAEIAAKLDKAEAALR